MYIMNYSNSYYIICEIIMQRLKDLKNVSILGLLCLSGCNTYTVEPTLNKTTNLKSCSLKNNKVKGETGFGKSRAIYLDLEKTESGKILLYPILRFNGRCSGQEGSFKSDSIFTFYLENKNNKAEEIKLPIPLRIENENSGYGVLNINSKATTLITKDQLLKISSADRIKFSLETHGEPIIGELDSGDLKPFQEFIKVCL